MNEKANKKNFGTQTILLSKPHQKNKVANKNNLSSIIKKEQEETKDRALCRKTRKNQAFEPNVYWLTHYVTPLTENNQKNRVEVQT